MSDVDGYTSAAVLINYLNRLFPSFAQSKIKYRLHTGKQHGLILDTIPKTAKLVIAPDSASNDYEIHQALRERGIDVLVLDHHEAERVSENACVINNQLCDYPTKSLSGVGMVYKFCSYLDKIMGTDYADLFLDLTAFGLIADMVSLLDMETRHLVMRGINQIRNPFLDTMITKNSFSIGEVVTPIGIAFYVAPYVNAMVRMGSQEEKMCLFESMLEFKAYELIPSTKRGCHGQQETRVEQACRNCTNTKNQQAKARDRSVEVLENIIEERNLLENKILTIKLDKNHSIDKNLTGLTANILMSKYQRPVLLLNEIQEDGVKKWAGSGRGYPKSGFEDFKAYLENSGLVDDATGHSNAFGATIADSNFKDFINYSNTTLADFDFTPCYKVDFIYQGGDFKGSDVIAVASLKSLWGQDVEEPYVAIESIKVHSGNVSLMSPDKNPTLKITLSNGTSLIKFKSSKEEYEQFQSENGCYNLTVVGRCEQNFWNGMVYPQIIIEDYEIMGEQKYYF